MTASQSTALMRWKMRSRRMPALLTTQSMRPKLSMAVLMMRSAPCGSATLSPLGTAMPPAFFDFGDHLIGHLDVGALALGRAAEVVDHHLGALGGGQHGDLLADAPPRARYDDDLTVNALCHFVLPLPAFR